MGLNSGIEWCDHTWNPWYGCHKVSEGCRNCYMYREQAHYGRDPNLVQRSKTTFKDPLRWAKMTRRKGDRYKVFVCSWSDFFIEEADPWRSEAWEIIRQTPEFIYLIPTKRIERLYQCLPEDWGNGWNNVWIGVSIEDQGSAEKRIPILLESKVQYRFISCEPMLESIDIGMSIADCDCCERWSSRWVRLNHIVHSDCFHYKDLERCFVEPGIYLAQSNRHGALSVLTDNGIWLGIKPDEFSCLPKLDWVICGGESGTQARPCHPDWMRIIRSQCIDADIPFFFKQWGEYLPMEPSPDQRGILDVKFDKVGKKRAGSVIDGQEWHQFPSSML